MTLEGRACCGACCIASGKRSQACLKFLRKASSVPIAAARSSIIGGGSASSYTNTGGAPSPASSAEMSLVALSLEISAIYVTAHHVARIVMSVAMARLFAGHVADR